MTMPLPPKRGPYPRAICIRWPCPNVTTGERRGWLCAKHAAEAARAKARRRPDLRSYKERQRRARAVVAWRAQWGDLCPGWPEAPGYLRPRPPHSCDPPGGRNALTADHVGMVALGHDAGGPLVVRCRSCNSARGAARRSTGSSFLARRRRP
jgi:5-methylcytosine-specific restriction protein A